MFILEAHSTSSAIVDAIEIFDRSDDGIRGVMRVYLHAHRNPGPHLGVLIQEKLKGDILGDWVLQRLPSGRDLRQKRRFGQARKPVKLGGLHGGQVQKKRKKSERPLLAVPMTASTHCSCMIEGKREDGTHDRGEATGRV
jgi:hypothetical protein